MSTENPTPWASMSSEEIVADIRDFMARARAVDPYPTHRCGTCRKDFDTHQVVWFKDKFWCANCFMEQGEKK